MKNLLIALMVLIPTCLLAHPDSETKGRKLTETFWKYAREQNYKKLNASFSNSFCSLSSHGPGNKKQTLQYLINPKIVSTVIYDLVVTSEDDCINTTYTMDLTTETNGIRTTIRYYELFVWAKHKGKWHIISDSFYRV